MRVSLVDKILGTILIDASSVDNNEGSVMLDYIDLKQGTEYILTYDFFDKQILTN